MGGLRHETWSGSAIGKTPEDGSYTQEDIIFILLYNTAFQKLPVISIFNNCILMHMSPCSEYVPHSKFNLLIKF